MAIPPGMGRGHPTPTSCLGTLPCPLDTRTLFYLGTQSHLPKHFVRWCP